VTKENGGKPPAVCYNRRSEDPRDDFSPLRPEGADAMIRTHAQPWLAVALILVATPLAFAADAPKLEIVGGGGRPPPTPAEFPVRD